MNQKLSEKDSGQENWSNDGEFVYCKHDDCNFFMRYKGQKRRFLCRFYPDRVELKCDSCGEKSTYKFKKDVVQKSIDENKYVTLQSLIADWEKTK